MADWIVVPIEQVGPSSFTGTEIRMWLDADFMTLGSRLPTPTPELAESLLAGRRRLTDRLTILDRRPTKPAEGTSRNAEG